MGLEQAKFERKKLIMPLLSIKKKKTYKFKMETQWGPPEPKIGAQFGFYSKKSAEKPFVTF